MINQAGATLSNVLLLARLLVPGRCLIVHTNAEKRYNGLDKKILTDEINCFY